MGRKLKVFCAVTVALAAYLWARSRPSIGKTVETHSGRLEGIVSVSRDGQEFYEWLGVPYAQPPVGNLRYASPKLVAKWDGVRTAHRYGPRCAQLEMLTHRFLGNEDCLYLNIHVPKRGDSDKLPKGLPVMFYVHGGGFNFMSSDDYRPDYFMDESVILVVINYRLGSFGFLSTGDGVIRGNMGLKDQALALKWIHDNIEAFGGDPKKITIFGESAGGASVHYFTLSPMTQGLFSKAISQSGAATNPWALDPPHVARELSLQFAASVGCNYTEDSTRLLNCMRNVDTRDLLNAAIPAMRDNTFYKPHLSGHFLRPTIEAIDDAEAFITEHPLKIIKEGKARQVPWMTGVTAHEGLLSSIEFLRNEDSMKDFEANWVEGIARIFGITEESERLPEIAQKIRQFYFPPDTNLTKQERLDQYTNMFSDALFNLHMSYSASLQREYSPVYLFHYNLPTGVSLATVLAEIQERFPLPIELGLIVGRLYLNYYLFGEKPKIYGVCHGDDVGMLFLVPGILSIAKNEDDPNLSQLYHYSKDMVKLWVDFAKDEQELKFRGQPVLPTERNGPLKYFEFSDTPKMIREPFEDRIAFLKSLNFVKCS